MVYCKCEIHKNKFASLKKTNWHKYHIKNIFLEWILDDFILSSIFFPHYFYIKMIDLKEIIYHEECFLKVTKEKRMKNHLNKIILLKLI